MKNVRYLIILVFMISLFCIRSLSFAAIINVAPEKMTIQEGIDLAESGDTVLAADGLYKGEGNVNIDFKGKKIAVKSENGPEATIIDCQSIPNTRGFIFQNDETEDSVLDGFTVKNGIHDVGGGIYCDYGSPTIKNCNIVWNKAVHNGDETNRGGGIYCYNSDTKIVDCKISNNGSGSGVYFEGEFSRNGVVLRESLSQPSIINSIVSDNTGAGIMCFHTVGVEIRNCTVTKNSGRGIVCNFFSRGGTNISNSVISHNTGGGIDCSETSILKVTDCLIKNNTAEFGGGIYCSPTSEIEVSHCIIVENIATENGGGIGVITTRGFATITQCTITRNSTNERGGGVYAFIEGSQFNFSNSIVWGNNSNDTHDEFSAIGGTIEITSCDIRDGLEGIGRQPDGEWFIYENNIDKDPLFVNPDRGDYRLSRNSPAKWMGPQTSVVGTLSVAPRGKQLVTWADLKRK